MALTKISGSVWDSTDNIGYYNVLDYGVAADGSTDDTSAIQTALSAVPAHSTLVFPKGQYKVRTGVTLSTSNVTLLGYGATILGGADLSAGDPLFDIDASNIKVKGFNFDMDVRAICLKFDPDSASISNIMVSDITSNDAFYTVDLRGDATYSIDHVKINNVIHVGTSGQNNAAVVAFYTNHVSYTDCYCRYASNAAAFVMQQCTYGTISGITTEDTATAASSDASIQIENSPGAFVTIMNNTCDYRIYIDDSTDVTVGPNLARELRFTVEDRSQTSINCTGGVYGKISLQDIGTAGSYRTSGNFVGITLDPAHYSETYGIITDGTYVGNVKFKDIEMVSDGSTANALFSRNASAEYHIRGCDFNDGTVTFSGSGGTVNIRDCVDYVTENSGSSSIPSGSTSVTITHGLSRTPAREDINVMPQENPTNSVGTIWVDNITSTQFDINCENDPGASNLDIAWKAICVRDL